MHALALSLSLLLLGDGGFVGEASEPDPQLRIRFAQIRQSIRIGHAPSYPCGETPAATLAQVLDRLKRLGYRAMVKKRGDVHVFGLHGVARDWGEGWRPVDVRTGCFIELDHEGRDRSYLGWEPDGVEE